MKYRKNIRLTNYDYSSDGYYFVTICTNYGKRMFEPRISRHYGDILPENVVAGPWPAAFRNNANVIEKNLLNIEKKFLVKVDFYCIMPEHIHIILVLSRQGRETTNTKLSWAINAFKGWATRIFKKRIFQPNYYEHIIRNEKSLAKIREYIKNNPYAEKLNWEEFDAQSSSQTRGNKTEK